MVVAEVQFCESWETSRAHPVMEMLVILQFWKVILGVAIWVSGCPVWRRDNVREAAKVGIVRILLPQVWPCNPLISEVVCDISTTSDANWLEESIVEQRVRNESARVYGFVRSINVEFSKRLAVAIVQITGAPVVPLQLRLVETLDVSAMILVEAC